VVHYGLVLMASEPGLFLLPTAWGPPGYHSIWRCFNFLNYERKMLQVYFFVVYLSCKGGTVSLTHKINNQKEKKKIFKVLVQNP